MKAIEFAPRVRGARRSGTDYVAHCPAHDDEHPSLSFRDGEHGLLVTCHAGCPSEAIVQVLGLRWSDLFEAREPHPGFHIAAEYGYRTEGGELLYVVERREPKAFRQRRPDGRGGWVWNVQGARQVVYRLPELRGQRRVFIVEGEKDADHLAALGRAATTNAGGAGKWTDVYSDQLRAAGCEEAIILPDNDPPGERHARTVAQSCLRAGLRVRIVRLPGLLPRGDVSDWLDAAHTLDELQALVDQAPAVDDSALTDPTGQLDFTPLGTLLAEPEESVRWVVEGRLPSKGLSVLAGKPKAGKSTLLSPA